MIALVALTVLLSSASVDYAHARYALSRDAGRWHAAARWSVVQWMAASIGFVVAVRLSLWYLPCEAIGLYLGTILARRRC